MPPSRTAATAASLNKDEYVFFWKTDRANGWASQWYRASFTATIEIDKGVKETVVFPTAEHWMMVQKALLFSDETVARTILGVSDGQMRSVKALGRKVKNFNEGKWKKERERIVLEGNMLKFGQNEELKQKLLETGEKTIVEASPSDRIWGIGISESKAVSVDKSKWGMNLLGRALMETRKRLNDLNVHNL